MGELQPHELNERVSEHRNRPLCFERFDAEQGRFFDDKFQFFDGSESLADCAQWSGVQHEHEQSVPFHNSAFGLE